MSNQANFILKVFILSLGVSVLIKYGGPSLPVGATSVNALIAVLTPSLILAIAFLWRVGKYRPINWYPAFHSRSTWLLRAGQSRMKNLRDCSSMPLTCLNKSQGLGCWMENKRSLKYSRSQSSEIQVVGRGTTYSLPSNLRNWERLYPKSLISTF